MCVLSCCPFLLLLFHFQIYHSAECDHKFLYVLMIAFVVAAIFSNSFISNMQLFCQDYVGKNSNWIKMDTKYCNAHMTQNFDWIHKVNGNVRKKRRISTFVNGNETHLLIAWIFSFMIIFCRNYHITSQTLMTVWYWHFFPVLVRYDSVDFIIITLHFFFSKWPQIKTILLSLTYFLAHLTHKATTHNDRKKRAHKTSTNSNNQTCHRSFVSVFVRHLSMTKTFDFSRVFV